MVSDPKLCQTKLPSILIKSHYNYKCHRNKEFFLLNPNFDYEKCIVNIDNFEPYRHDSMCPTNMFLTEKEDHGHGHVESWMKVMGKFSPKSDDVYSMKWNSSVREVKTIYVSW